MTLNRGFEYREQIGSRGAGRTVLDYLARFYTHSSREAWKLRTDGGEVFLDGAQAQCDTVLKQGQRLTWRRPPWDEPAVPTSYAVLYEDKDILAVAKPRGLPTIPAGGFLEHTLLMLVRRYYPEASPIHRLGRGTSGALLFARTASACSILCAALRQNRMLKSYRALATGIVERDSFSIEVPIGPMPHPRLGSVYAANPNGKRARSHVSVLERHADASLLEVRIETGRPHQIRIHLAATGHPLVGDPLYVAGGGIKESETALPGDCGYFLHAERLCLIHPTTGVPLEIWCSPPPELRSRSRTALSPSAIPTWRTADLF